MKKSTKAKKKLPSLTIVDGVIVSHSGFKPSKTVKRDIAKWGKVEQGKLKLKKAELTKLIRGLVDAAVLGNEDALMFFLTTCMKYDELRAEFLQDLRKALDEREAALKAKANG